MTKEKSSAYDKGEVASQKVEGQPQIMLNFDVLPDLSIAIPYVGIDLIEFKKAEDADSIHIHYSEQEYILTGDNLRGLYLHFTQHIVSSVRVAENATKGAKITGIDVKTREENET